MMDSTPKLRLDPSLILAACALLIFLSSTHLAGMVGHYVYMHFLRGLTSFYVAQKSIHVMLFIAFGFACYWVLPRQSPKMRFGIAALASLIVGSGSEILQIFTHRDPSVIDALINLASGTAGGAIAMALHRINRRSSSGIAKS